VSTIIPPAAALITPVKTALICVERPTARQLLTRTLTAGTSVDIVGAVAGGFAVADSCTARPADVVFIGVHRGSTTGADAMSLLFGLHPAAKVLVFGSTRDAPLLATNTVRTRAVDQERSRGFADSHRRQGFPPHTVEETVAESSDSVSATDAHAGSIHPPPGADTDQTRE
jgi:chemotaxis response regulator CheB